MSLIKRKYNEKVIILTESGQHTRERQGNDLQKYKLKHRHSRSISYLEVEVETSYKLLNFLIKMHKMNAGIQIMYGIKLLEIDSICHEAG